MNLNLRYELNDLIETDPKELLVGLIRRKLERVIDDPMPLELWCSINDPLEEALWDHADLSFRCLYSAITEYEF